MFISTLKELFHPDDESCTFLSNISKLQISTRLYVDTTQKTTFFIAMPLKFPNLMCIVLHVYNALA
jgi:hypothetical protein